MKKELPSKTAVVAGSKFRMAPTDGGTVLAKAQSWPTGVYHAAASVHRELQTRLDARRKQVLG